MFNILEILPLFEKNVNVERNDKTMILNYAIYLISPMTILLQIINKYNELKQLDI